MLSAAFRSRMDVVALAILVYVSVLVVLQAGILLDGSYVHEESRLLFRYHQVSDPALFAGDYLMAFIGAFPQPHLYETLTRLWLSSGGDLLLWHRLVALLCWLAFLGGLAVAARALGDRMTVLGALGLALAQPLYLHQITSALPHAFAFALLIWALVALLHRSSLGLVVVVLLSGLLYPAAAPLTGLYLAWHLLLTRRILQRLRTEQLKTLLLLTLTGAVSVWLVLSSLKGTDEFGAALAPMQQMDVYPENGPEGRHFYGVFNPLKYVAGKAMAQFRTAEHLYALLLLMAFCLVATYGFFSLPKKGPVRPALVAFTLSSLAVCLVIFFVKPFYSYRFVLYPALTVLPLLFMVGLQRFMEGIAQIVRYPRAAALAVLALVALASDSLDPKKLGYWWRLDSEHRQVMRFAAAQPPDRLFAVWPGVETPLELIPYIARRPLFVMRKAHYPSYEDHILEMRARTHALIEAYLATEEAPLRALHCRWRVDYLIVEKKHFAANGDQPRYFAPFDRRIETLWRGQGSGDFLLGRPDRRFVVLETAQHRVLDLAALAPRGSGCAARDRSG